MKHVVTILIGREDGSVSSETREFGGFKRDLRALVAWLQTHHIQQVVMESAGIYWKSVLGHLKRPPFPPRSSMPFMSERRPGASFIAEHLFQRPEGQITLRGRSSSWFRCNH